MKNKVEIVTKNSIKFSDEVAISAIDIENEHM